MKITRTQFMTAIASTLGVLRFTKKPANDNERYPWCDARHPEVPGNSFREIRMRCRVTLSGEDVTNRCYFYDVNQRLVGLYKERNGQKYYDPAINGIAQECRSGDVEVFVS